MTRPQLPSIDAEPEDTPAALSGRGAAVAVVVVVGVYGGFWALTGDWIVGLLVTAAAAVCVFASVFTAWTVDRLRRQDRRHDRLEGQLRQLRGWVNADRSDFLGHVSAARNTALDGDEVGRRRVGLTARVPVQRQDDGESRG